VRQRINSGNSYSSNAHAYKRNYATAKSEHGSRNPGQKRTRGGKEVEEEVEEVEEDSGEPGECKQQ